jgi:hypothetical protein
MKQFEKDVKKMSDDQLDAFIVRHGGTAWPFENRANKEAEALNLASIGYVNRLGNYLRKKDDMIQDV